MTIKPNTLPLKEGGKVENRAKYPQSQRAGLACVGLGGIWSFRPAFCVPFCRQKGTEKKQQKLANQPTATTKAKESVARYEEILSPDKSGSE